MYFSKLPPQFLHFLLCPSRWHLAQAEVAQFVRDLVHGGSNLVCVGWYMVAARWQQYLVHGGSKSKSLVHGGSKSKILAQFVRDG